MECYTTLEQRESSLLKLRPTTSTNWVPLPYGFYIQKFSYTSYLHLRFLPFTFFPFIYLHHYLRITFKIEYTSRNLSWGNTIYWRIFKERKLKTKKQTPTISKIHCNTATFQPSFFSSKLISLPPPYFTKRSNQRSSTFFHYQIYQPTCICFFLLSSHRLSGPGSQPKLTPFSCTY